PPLAFYLPTLLPTRARLHWLPGASRSTQGLVSAHPPATIAALVASLSPLQPPTGRALHNQSPVKHPSPAGQSATSPAESLFPKPPQCQYCLAAPHSQNLDPRH